MRYIIQYHKALQSTTQKHSQTIDIDTMDYYQAIDIITDWLIDTYHFQPQMILNRYTVKISPRPTAYCIACGCTIEKIRNQHYCAECAEEVKKYNNREAYKRYYNKAYHNGDMKTYQKILARKRSNALLKSGRLTRNVCAICGKHDGMLHFHHINYGDKLSQYSVICVCPQCHANIHKEMKNENNN